ncbi:hypothetical protein EKG40_12895 [Pseudomonas moorei]|nr:hypothetical protein EKG40_12895 [Pseudomonas moorei]
MPVFAFIIGHQHPLKLAEVPVGASVLAIAVDQSIAMLAVGPSSRASSLPQGSTFIPRRS